MIFLLEPESYQVNILFQINQSLYKNTGRKLLDVTDQVIPELSDFGIINDFLSTDFNGDGVDDIIVAGEWTGIGFF